MNILLNFEIFYDDRLSIVMYLLTSLMLWLKKNPCCLWSIGLYVESSSNGFIVDDTAPEVALEPSFPANLVTFDTGTDQYYQVHRTTLKVEWQVSDPESYIERQYLTIKSHIGGEFNSAPTQVLLSLIIKSS